MNSGKLHIVKNFFGGILFAASFLILILLLVKIPLPLPSIAIAFNDYGLLFKLSGMLVCAIVIMYLVYLQANDIYKKNTAKLIDTRELAHFKYNLLYWNNFKRKEFLIKGAIYILKIGLIYIPLFILLRYLHLSEPRFFLISLIFIVTFTIPIIPFTIGKFIGEIRNELFKEINEIKIYREGLTINESYYPYHHYINNKLNYKLVAVERCKRYNIDCLKFKSIKTKFHEDMEGPGYVIPSKINIIVPLPEHITLDLEKLKNQLF